MDNRILDITGQRFGRLKAVKFVEKRIRSKKDPHHYDYYWLFRCDCGRKVTINKRSVIRKNTRSCGCYNLEILKRGGRYNNNYRHGMKNSAFYQVWLNMKTRIQYPCSNSYKNYGARGITICSRWMKFENFRDDMHKSYLEHIKQYGKKNTFIERINNNGNYLLENCRWATREEQNFNKRNNRIINFKGINKTVTEWCRILKLPHSAISRRINHLKWNINRALTTPIQ